jgi:hypothetical protein
MDTNIRGKLLLERKITHGAPPDTMVIITPTNILCDMIS